jgi:hypothetical protein
MILQRFFPPVPIPYPHISESVYSNGELQLKEL